MSNNSTIIAVALGLGAYLFMTKAKAGSPVTQAGMARPTITGNTQRPMQSDFAQNVGALGNLAGMVKGLFGSGSSYQSANDGNAGEAQAREYFLSNQDLFAVNPPTSYSNYEGNYGGIDGR
jgi:hypothetical protein